MKIFSSARRRAFALTAIAAVLSNALCAASAQTAAQKQSAASRLNEEQRAVHVLNRLAFGARPGDVERVRGLGVDEYIERQLNPSKIDDAALAARLERLPTLRMSNSELLAKYPQPGQLLRRLQREGNLPPELAALVRQRQQAQQGGEQSKQNDAMNAPNADAQNAPNAPNADAEKTIAEAMRPEMPRPGVGNNDARDAADPQRRAYRQAVAKYMRENGLESPQRLIAEL